MKNKSTYDNFIDTYIKKFVDFIFPPSLNKKITNVSEYVKIQEHINNLILEGIQKSPSILTLLKNPKQQIDPELEDKFKIIDEICKKKFRDGADKHGIFNPDTDIVDRLEEAKNELYDTINYCKMEIVKLNKIQVEIENIRKEIDDNI